MGELRSKCCGATVKTIKNTAYIVEEAKTEERDFFICSKCGFDFGYEGVIRKSITFEVGK